MLLLLIGPTVFFLPKFFEIRTRDICENNDNRACENHIPKVYNCSELLTGEFENSSEFLSILDNYSMTRINSTIPNIVDQDRQTDRICNHILYLIQHLMDNEVPILRNNDESSVEVINNHTSVSKDNITLHMDYNISTHIARVFLRRVIPILDQTDMRKNTLYYKIYILGLTTLCAQIIPMAILIYLNIKICLALRTSTGNYLTMAIRNQRKKYLKVKNSMKNRTTLKDP